MYKLYILILLLTLIPFILSGISVKKLKSSVTLVEGIPLTTGATKISSKGPDIKRSKYYVYLTGAAYCSNKDLPSWKCKYCKKATGQAFSAVLFNATTNTQALVTTNSAKKEIVVTFRGSYNVANALQDILLVQTDASDTNNKIRVHRGFLAATNSLYPQVVSKLTELLKKNKGYNVVIAGHSLGASMASITLYKLNNKINVPSNFPSPKSYALFAYGQPRTGNKAYANYFNSLNIQISRIVSNGDIFAHAVVADLGYLHHGTELWIKAKKNKVCSKTVYEDPKCSNSLSPLYNPIDHLLYWDVDYLNCGESDILAVLTQLAVPISNL